MTIGDKGILNKTIQARENMNKKSALEELNLLVAESKIELLSQNVINPSLKEIFDNIKTKKITILI